MTKQGRIWAILAGAAVIALTGCSGSPSSTVPSVLTGSSPAHSVSATAAATGNKVTGNGGGARPSSSPAPAASQPVPSASASIPASSVGTSIPFPVAVGDTWLYRTQSSSSGESGTTTNEIVAAGPTSAGYRVEMVSSSNVSGLGAGTEPVFYFRSDGSIGWPVTDVGGLTAESSVRWPDAAGLLYGNAYHSVVPVEVALGGSQQSANATVTVQGEGTAPVTVPAGTYNALLVKMTFSTKLGSDTVTTVISNWLAASTGPVKIQVTTTVGGKTEIAGTSELLKFTKASSPSDNS
jgi:hypothetical protein